MSPSGFFLFKSWKTSQNVYTLILLQIPKSSYIRKVQMHGGDSKDSILKGRGHKYEYCLIFTRQCGQKHCEGWKNYFLYHRSLHIVVIQ